MKYPMTEIASPSTSYLYTGMVYGRFELGYRIYWKDYNKIVHWYSCCLD
jgi:hypothetical protein